MDLSELQTFCQGDKNIADYAIFENMKFFQEFGEFGNANYHVTRVRVLHFFWTFCRIGNLSMWTPSLRRLLAVSYGTTAWWLAISSAIYTTRLFLLRRVSHRSPKSTYFQSKSRQLIRTGFLIAKKTQPSNSSRLASLSSSLSCGHLKWSQMERNKWKPSFCRVISGTDSCQKVMQQLLLQAAWLCWLAHFCEDKNRRRVIINTVKLTYNINHTDK